MSKFNDMMLNRHCKAVAAETVASQNLSEHDKQRRKMMRSIFTFTMVMSLMLMMGISAFAGGDDLGGIGNAIANGMGSVYKILRIVCIPISVVAVIAAAFEFFVGGERGAQKAMKILLYCGVGVLVAFIAPIAIKTVAGWFGSVGTGNVFTGSDLGAA